MRMAAKQLVGLEAKDAIGFVEALLARVTRWRSQRRLASGSDEVWRKTLLGSEARRPIL
jgi:hypothetical protein